MGPLISTRAPDRAERFSWSRTFVHETNKKNGVPGANRTHDLRHVTATSYHLNHGNIVSGRATITPYGLSLDRIPRRLAQIGAPAAGCRIELLVGNWCAPSESNRDIPLFRRALEPSQPRAHEESCRRDLNPHIHALQACPWPFGSLQQINNVRTRSFGPRLTLST